MILNYTSIRHFLTLKLNNTKLKCVWLNISALKYLCESSIVITLETWQSPVHRTLDIPPDLRPSYLYSTADASWRAWSSTVQVQIDADPKYLPNWFFENFNFKIMLLLTKTKFNYFPNRTFDLEKLFQE
jgi:hypothetical protein